MSTQANLAKVYKIKGKRPINEIGSCFETAIRQAIFAPGAEEAGISNIRLCHGIGVASMPGQEGLPMAHAWVEFDDNRGRRLAIDTTWAEFYLAIDYRETLQLSYCREYTPAGAMTLWKLKNMPGPWDPAIHRISEMANL